MSRNRVRNFSINRSLAYLALKTYVSGGKSVTKPVQCSDLSNCAEENSVRWKTEFGNKIKVAVNIKNSSSTNVYGTLDTVSETKPQIFIDTYDFNFIYIECSTEGSTYFDSVFRNLSRNGIFCISTWDDPALFARPPEPALRNYSGRITRTFYAPELAIRLIISEMVRSAARYGKAVEVLFSALYKSSITIIVSIKKGPSHAVNCVQQVLNVIHCLSCEEREFVPHKHGFVTGSPISLLKCDCKKIPESASMLLGPVWSGPLASVAFVHDMLSNAASESVHTQALLLQILDETRCDSLKTKGIKTKCISKGICNVEIESDIHTPIEEENKIHTKCKRDLDTTVRGDEKRLKLSELPPAPVFYYNLHKHSPKGPTLEKVSKVIEILHRSGFRASRTHFDPGAVRTDANLPQLQSVLSDSVDVSK